MNQFTHSCIHALRKYDKLRLFKCLSFVFCLALIFSSCSKEGLKNNAINSTHSASVNLPCSYNPISDHYLNLLANPSDVEDERVKLSVYLFGYAIHQATLDNTLRAYLTNNFQSTTQINSIVELADANPLLEQFLNLQLDAEIENVSAQYSIYGGIDMENFSIIVNASNAIEKVAELMYYGDDEYYPFIGIMNPAVATNLDDLIVALSEEVGEEDEDIIAGWDFNSSQIALDEVNTSSCQHGILIISTGYEDPISIDSDPINDNIVVENTNTVSDRMMEFRLNLRVYQIKNPFFFERRRNHLEVTYDVSYFNQSPQEASARGSRHKRDVNWRSVRASDTFQVDDFMSSLSASQLEVLPNMFFVAFERDWYVIPRNRKPVTVTCDDCSPGANNEVSVSIPTARHNEWYQAWATQRSNAFPNIGSAIDRTNNKSRFRIVRTQ